MDTTTALPTNLVHSFYTLPSQAVRAQYETMINIANNNPAAIACHRISSHQAGDLARSISF